jgi:glyoxylase-like metal-dependent hydrolase (beta-lactamase superfamily II)
MTTTHRIESTAGDTPVNAYLIEGESTVVAVDGTLTVAGGRAVRERVAAIAKPLAALVVTHAHPDHYGGVVEAVAGTDAPVIATAGVDRVIRRDDALKEEILRPMFGDQWPSERAFPTEIVDDGAELTFGDIELAVRDLGPGESPHDSIWLLGDTPTTVFSGDQAYNHMHCYLADGHWEEWLDHIEALTSELPSDAVLHPGHGATARPELLAWQRAYIERFVEAVRRADWSDVERAKGSVLDAITGYLDTDDLRFLIELSIEPVAARLGLVDPEGD